MTEHNHRNGDQRPISLAELLGELRDFVRTFVVLGGDELVAVALWIVHTHAFEAADATPYLAITSAEKQSGKTRLLEVLELLVQGPWLTGRVTAAVLARKVHAERPTLLLDESDAAFNGEKEYAETLRGILNTGHRRGGKTSVCVGQGTGITYQDFSTFCPKAIAGIGRLPDTVADRSIAVRLNRRAPHETVHRFRRREVVLGAEILRQAVERLGEVEAEGLMDARPELPDHLGDRAADCWEPLLAIADLAGPEWGTRARTAAVSLFTSEEDDSRGVELLRTLREVFDGEHAMFTEALIGALNAREEEPWCGWHRGDGLQSRDLARLLRPYGIKSRTVRVGEETKKGYLREQLEEIWARYCPSLEKASHASHASHLSPDAERDVTDVTDVTDFSDTGEADDPPSEAELAELADLELGRIRQKFGDRARDLLREKSPHLNADQVEAIVRQMEETA